MSLRLLPQGPPSPSFGRAAGNRTRTTRPPALRTTTIRQPVLYLSFFIPQTCVIEHNHLLGTTTIRQPVHLTARLDDVPLVGPPEIEPGLYPDCLMMFLFGPPGIEPGLYPDRLMMFLFGPPGIEPGLYEPESHVLPVYYGPNKNIICESHDYRPTPHRRLTTCHRPPMSTCAPCRIRTYDLSNVNRTL